MNNDARSKLRNMGGIMASSPELMQVAQKFQAGGGVSAGPSPLRTIPTVRQPEMPELGARNPGYAPGLLATGTVDPVLAGTRRVAPLSPTQARRNAILERAAMNSPTYGSGAQPFPSSPDMPFEPRVPAGPEAGLPQRAADRFISDLMAGEISSLEQEEITIDDLLDISISRGIPIQELVDMMPEGVKSKVEASVEQRMGEYLPVPTIGDQISPIAPRSRTRTIGRNVESLEGPEATGLGGQMRPTPEIIDEDIANIEDDTTLAPDEAMPPMIADDPEGTAEEALSSLDKSYEEKLALFNKVFGDGDEEDSKDKAMNLAMIGLAIAAGQSPNALTNIAQGLAVGVKGIGAQRKERQAKREKTKLLALDAALKEEGANQGFMRELMLKGADVSDYSDKTKDIDTPLGKLTVALPTASAAAKGVEPQLLTGSDLERQFKTKVEEKNRFMGMAQEAIDILDKPGDTVAGIGGATLRTLKSFKNAGAIPDAMYERITGLAEGEISDATRFDVIMTNMAAQLAPMLLGESGRTISDGDRARVADQLGVSYDPASVSDGIPGLTITGFGNVATKGEGGLKERLTQIQGLLDSSYQPVFDTYKQYNPVGYNDYIKSLEEAKPSKANVRKFDAQGNPIQ